ncbi:hypothetical protein Afe04nite_16830 [Asanoa ferruginea]|nr:hypothetical protein Afe04nite_16830 [Asanoa ferruginea]
MNAVRPTAGRLGSPTVTSTTPSTRKATIADTLMAENQYSSVPKARTENRLVTTTAAADSATGIQRGTCGHQ